MEKDRGIKITNVDKKKQCDIHVVIVSCPDCGCEYTYDIGYGLRECFDCLTAFKGN
jgi:hypothetical protein